MRRQVGINMLQNIYFRVIFIFLIYSLLSLLMYITGYPQDALKLELFGAVMLSTFVLVYFLVERYTHLREDERRDVSAIVGFATGYSLSVYYSEKASYILLLWTVGFALHLVYLKIKSKRSKVK